MRERRLIVWAVVAVVMLGPACAVEAAWVRAKGAVGAAGQIDKLIDQEPPAPLIPTFATGQFNDGQKGFFTEADLGHGALRGRAFVNGGSGNANVNPVLGETITFDNQTGAASEWEFTFNIEGNVQTGANPIPVEQDFGSIGTFRTTFVQFAVHIFPGNTVGPIGSPNDWQQTGNRLFSEVKNIAGLPTTGLLENFNEHLTDQISGSIPLVSGINAFDVVLVLAVAGSIPGTTDSSFDMDFGSTAALTIDSEVPFVSESEVFLTGENLVPEPATLTLALLALAAAGTRRRRIG